MEANANIKIPPVVAILIAAIVAAATMPTLVTWGIGSLFLMFVTGIGATMVLIYLMVVLARESLVGNVSELGGAIGLMLLAILAMLVKLGTTAVGIILIAKVLAWITPALDFVDVKVLAGIMILLSAIQAFMNK